MGIRTFYTVVKCYEHTSTSPFTSTKEKAVSSFSATLLADKHPISLYASCGSSFTAGASSIID